VPHRRTPLTEAYSEADPGSPPGQTPPEHDDWPVNSQIPLTYEPLRAIA